MFNFNSSHIHIEMQCWIFNSNVSIHHILYSLHDILFCRRNLIFYPISCFDEVWIHTKHSQSNSKRLDFISLFNLHQSNKINNKKCVCSYFMKEFEPLAWNTYLAMYNVFESQYLSLLFLFILLFDSNLQCIK